MEGDDAQPPAGAEQVHEVAQRVRQGRELVIHSDAQRLESPRRRMARGAAASEPRESVRLRRAFPFNERANRFD